MSHLSQADDLLRYTVVARRPGHRNWIELGAVGSRKAAADLLRRARCASRKSDYQVITEAA